MFWENEEHFFFLEISIYLLEFFGENKDHFFTIEISIYFWGDQPIFPAKKYLFFILEYDQMSKNKGF